MPVPPIIDDETASHPSAVAVPWFTPLTDALSAATISHEQYDAIRRGLGEPPDDNARDVEPGFFARAWREAAIVLIAEAADRGVEDLGAASRLARDTLDPAGTTLRFEERYASRAFTTWVDRDGQRHARIRFDDAAGTWVHTILSAALRPRRGPRFVDPAAPEADPGARDDLDEGGDNWAAAVDDTRTNEQLQYDTMMAILRTGAAADPTRAFGDRQPGIRVVTTAETVADRDEHGHLTGTAVCEDTGQTIPGFVLETYLCDTGTVPVTVDAFGSPLDVGREKRLFTRRQRIAIAARTAGACGAAQHRTAAKLTTSTTGGNTMAEPTSPMASSCARTATSGSTTSIGGSPAGAECTGSTRHRASTDYHRRHRGN